MKTGRSSPVAMVSLAASAILAFAATPLAAQDPDPFGPLAVFQMAHRQDWVLRASSGSGGAVVGRVLEVDATSARLEGGSVRFAELVLLERGERHSGGAVRGAVIGGAILGGLAALLLYVAPIDDDLEEGEVVLGISAAAGVGALVGGVIGAARSRPGMHWIPIWPGHSVDR